MIVFITPEGYGILKTITFSTFPTSEEIKTIVLVTPEGKGGGKTIVFNITTDGFYAFGSIRTMR